MRFTRTLLMVLCAVLLFLMFGCGADDPEYMHPYGEGVDPDSVTTGVFQTRTTTAATVPSTTATTVSGSAPEGYHLCPECHGEPIVCEYCEGTGQKLVEESDFEAAIYGPHYVECDMCSPEYPGYYLCETCQNLFYIPE